VAVAGAGLAHLPGTGAGDAHQGRLGGAVRQAKALVARVPHQQPVAAQGPRWTRGGRSCHDALGPFGGAKACQEAVLGRRMAGVGDVPNHAQGGYRRAVGESGACGQL